MEPLGSDFEVRLKVVFLRPTSENFHKKTTKQIFGGLEQVTSLSHAEGQRGWTEVYASTGIKSRFTFPTLGPKMMIHILKRKKKEEEQYRIASPPLSPSV